MTKRIFALLLAVLLACALLPGLADGGYTVSVDDEIGLLTPLEQVLVARDMAPLTAYGDAVFWSTNASGTVDVLAEQYFDAHLSTQHGHSGVILVIDMNSREICIFTRGDLEKKVGRAGAYAITDNIYRYASFAQYYQCAREGFAQVLSLAEGQRIFSPMRVLCNLLLAISIGLMAAYLLARRFSVQPLRTDVSDTLNAKASVRMTLTNKRLVKSTRRRLDNGGSRSGGFSGGGFSGGGGGGGFSGGGSSGSHRF